jgi:LysM repeat protein
MKSAQTALSLGLLVAGALLAGACVSSEDDVGDDSAAITDIPTTSVLNQGMTGSCWLYATGAWIESLHASATGDTSTHYSPAYWNYWAWYLQIVGGASEIDFGGFWRDAVDIIGQYGLMPLGEFIVGEATRPLVAKTVINLALSSGSLKTREARSDGAKVRAVLDDAFLLSSQTRQTLTTAFGADGRRTFVKGAKPSGKLVDPHDLPVRTPRPGTAPLDTTLAGAKSMTGLPGVFAAAQGSEYTVKAGDTMGAIATKFKTTVRALVAVNGIDDPNRISAGQSLLIPPAHEETAPPQSDPAPPAVTSAPADGQDPWRAFTRRLQRALNDGAPLPIAWFINFDDADWSGHFKRSSKMALELRTGWHETLITDYEAVHVPTFGTLKVGAVATPEQKEAALDPTARVSFFRVKNSWGGPMSRLFAPLAPVAGYNDLDGDYLEQSLPICKLSSALGSKSSDCPRTGPFVYEVVLPAGY